MAQFNAINRGVYIADNLYFLRAVNTESVDLVCIDPPFAKNETFGRKKANDQDPLKPPLTPAERDNELRLLASWGIKTPADADAARINWPETAYKDFWSWENDIHEDWLVDLRRTHEPVADLIKVTRYTHSESTAAYLCYMAIRLLEIHRVLKTTGSLYLHCDHTVNGYLRQLLDAVFGDGENDTPGFRNEITWQRAAGRAKGSQHAPKSLGVDTDTILWYSKGNQTTFHGVYQNLNESEMRKLFPHDDNDGKGRYNTNVPLFCQPSMGPRPNLCYEYNGVHNPHPSGWRVSRKKLAEMDSRGEIIWRDGKRPLRKSYAKDYQGKPVGSLWTDINNLTAIGENAERTGYPTQKPVALAERIIKASTNTGDVVLDCFAGCAYVAVAAERLKRRWVACDIQPRSWTVFKRQFNKPQLTLLTCHDLTTGQQVLSDNPIVTIHGPRQLPEREYWPDEGPDADVPPVKDLRLPEPKFKVPASIIPEPEMLQELLKLSGYTAWCCGFANRRPGGKIVETTRNFHLDHIAPKSKGNTGTSNDIQNRAPMCPYHNIRKNNRRVGLAEYRQEIADAGELMVDTVNDLINLDYALVEANRLFGIAWAKKYPMGV